jgi:beta-lactamase class C
MNRRQFTQRALAGASIPLLLGVRSTAFGADDDARVRQAVDAAIKPVMQQYGIPGIAVGVTIDGTRHFVEYGSASPSAEMPVTRDTLFELGSISKTFTATLTMMAVLDGKLSLQDTVGQHMPELKDAPIGAVRLLDLGTHTAGGFPLQLPDDVQTDDQLMAWYRAWKPKYPEGAIRTYANPSIALLGIVTARAMGQDFVALAEQRLFPALGLKRTFINVPAAEMASYAWGTNSAGKAVHVSPSPIANEAYGVKSNTVDMLRFLEVNMGVGSVDENVARAVAATHTGYYRTGPFIQDLIWEQYPYPAKLDDMMAGNAPAIGGGKPVPATAIEPPMPPRADAVLNKTGSTGGFGAYVVFIPEKKAGMVILANKTYPNPVRAKAGYQVLSELVG